MASQPCTYCSHELGEHVPVCEKGMHTGLPCGCTGPRAQAHISVTRALLNMERSGQISQQPAEPGGTGGPRPPADVAEAIRWIESLRDHRYAVRAPYRSGTGPAYRAEGEMNAFEMALNLLYNGDPENPSREGFPT
jgi:hypothetical protein